MRLMECEKCGKMFFQKDHTDTGSFIRSGRSLMEELSKKEAVYCTKCGKKQESKTLAIPI